MSARYSIKTTWAFCEALHEAGLLDDPQSVRRVIIDLKFDSVPLIYVERIADKRLLDVLIQSGIEIVDNSSEAAS